MNIFVLDRNPIIAARYHNDVHVNKMLTEAVQLLSAASRLVGFPQGMRVAKSHYSHPCVLWVAASLSNWLWLRDLALALKVEFSYRYDNPKHKSARVLHKLKVPPIPDRGLTPFPQCMPDDVRDRNVVKAHRLNYSKYKRHLAKWRKRGTPAWYDFTVKPVMPTPKRKRT